MTPYHFLLGGHDLEMLTIRSLLDKRHLNYTDRNLNWGADWSDYQDIIDTFDSNSTRLVGIELSGQKPENALLIDHHNELSHLPASIEQLAQLLSVELNRFQQLVAANDKGYIPAMKQAGATDEEIAHIHRLDRQAQGVTEEMEQQAEKDIRLIKFNPDFTVIHTNLTKFSPITDRLQVPRLLVYNSRELTYFGEGATRLGQIFANEVAAGRAYYGGGPNGFFGIGAGHYNSETIKEFVNKISTLLQHS